LVPKAEKKAAGCTLGESERAIVVGFRERRGGKGWAFGGGSPQEKRGVLGTSFVPGLPQEKRRRGLADRENGRERPRVPFGGRLGEKKRI